MTELQMGLIGLGVAAVFGVFGYNKWQEMRQRKVAEAVLKPQHEDVLLLAGQFLRLDIGISGRLRRAHVGRRGRGHACLAAHGQGGDAARV